MAKLSEKTITELEDRKVLLITKMESRRKELTMTVNTLAEMIAEVDKELKSREVVTTTNE